MSSEGSVSSGSRIGQFGLYRSIDARTEEFLKLSRKRQIRQGCACAAASTAITVTVVIVLFCVFEFSLSSEANKGNVLKSNWLTLMNDTSGESLFSSKFSTTNIDKNTLTLLPLLFKAIKKNALLEKLLDDHSSSSPSDDKKETTEYSFNPSTLVSRNWFKMPTTKLVAIEYKTSPVVYYRDPTKTIDQYTKIRKIRDYQRVFNYVDKMISEKVYIRPIAVPTLKEETYSTEILLTDLSVKNVTEKLVTRFETTTLASNIKTTEKHNFQCNCPKKFGILLQKILTSINNLLPDIISKRKKQTTPSSDSALLLSIITSPNVSNKSFIFNTTVPVASPLFFTTQKESNTFPSETNLSTEKNIYFFNNIMRLTKQPTTIRKNLISSTENISQTTKIQFINKYKNIINRKQVLRKEEHKNNSTIKTKTYQEPFLVWKDFDGTLTSSSAPEYQNNNYKTSTYSPKSTLNYFNYFENKLNQLTNEINPLFLQKKLNLTKLTREKPKFTNIKVNDYNIYDFLPIEMNETTQNNKSNTSHTQKEIVTEKYFSIDRINSNKNIDKIINNINETDARNLYMNTIPVTNFDNLIENKNTYRSIKNNAMSFNNKTQKNKPKSIVYLKSNGTAINHYIGEPTITYFNTIKLNNKTLDHVTENGLENLLRKNYGFVKTPSILPKLKENQYLQKLANKTTAEKSESQENRMEYEDFFLEEVLKITGQPMDETEARGNGNQQDSAYKIKSGLKESIYGDEVNTFPEEFSEITRQPENTTDKQIPKENRNQQTVAYKITSDKPEKKGALIKNEAEFLSGEFLEITRQPDNTTDKLNKNSYPKKQTHEFTWEDLKIDDIPPWKSMIPESKPVYLEVFRNYLKNDDPEEHDYDIQSNLYDFNI